MSRSLVGSLDLGIMIDIGETYPEYKQRQLIIGDYTMACMGNIIKKATGIDIEILWAKEDQFNIGESRKGYELKYDSRWRATGNLFVEIMEKTREGTWINSGIYRGDNTEFYVIGDLETMWVFRINVIRDKVEATGPYDGFKLRRVITGADSGIGALLPIEEKYSGAIGQEIVVMDRPEPGVHCVVCDWVDGAKYSIDEDPFVREAFEAKAIRYIDELRSFYGNGKMGPMPSPQDFGIDPEVEKL